MRHSDESRNQIIITPTLPLPEGVKKLVWFSFASFRRKPESSISTALQINWTPAFAGVTAEIQFFHSFPHQGGGNWPDPKFFPSPRGRGRGRGIKKEIPIRSSYFKAFWTPAFAGVTIQETFYGIIKNSGDQNHLCTNVRRFGGFGYGTSSRRFITN
jgi:hypothetical protein